MYCNAHDNLHPIKANIRNTFNMLQKSRVCKSAMLCRGVYFSHRNVTSFNKHTQGTRQCLVYCVLQLQTLDTQCPQKRQKKGIPFKHFFDQILFQAESLKQYVGELVQITNQIQSFNIATPVAEDNLKRRYLKRRSWTFAALYNQTNEWSFVFSYCILVTQKLKKRQCHKSHYLLAIKTAVQHWLLVNEWLIVLVNAKQAHIKKVVI